jgi:hypothetical protein
MKAYFYQRQVYQYLTRVIPEGKRPKQPFVFSRVLLESAIGRISRGILSPDTTKALGGLNAVHWFAEYLFQHQAVSERERADIQFWCEGLWRDSLPGFMQQELEAPAFEAFPQ